jgi:hypothetical protein
MVRTPSDFARRFTFLEENFSKIPQTAIKKFFLGLPEKMRIILFELFVDWGIKPSMTERPGFGQLENGHVLKSLKISLLQVHVNQ